MTAAHPASGDGAPPPYLLPAPGTSTANRLSDSTLYGPSIQAGRIHGGVHFYEVPSTPPVPRQLLPVPDTFTDRETDLATLITQIGQRPDYGVRLVVISGPGGVGKTTLANRLLHQVSTAYGGGQLYADLRGYAPAGPAGTGEVLARFLRSLRPGAQPASMEELAAWWRSVTASQPDRPAIVLLDNARNAAQVRALLPGGMGHLVVVTSRDHLAVLGRPGLSRLLSPLPTPLGSGCRQLRSPRCDGARGAGLPPPLGQTALSTAHRDEKSYRAGRSTVRQQGPEMTTHPDGLLSVDTCAGKPYARIERGRRKRARKEHRASNYQ